MIVAAVIRNTTDLAPGFRIEQRTVDDIGTIALSLFLAMALMSLRLWELLDLAVPMLVILTAQVAMMAAFAYFITYRVMAPMVGAFFIDFTNALIITVFISIVG
jgi:ESS family glutamate:Na+ symporter